MLLTYDLATRVDIGTLPSDFTPAPSCDIAYVISYSYGAPDIIFGAECVTDSYGADPEYAYDDSCYPSPCADISDDYSPFFSPASICPRGFTSACGITKTASQAAPAQTGERNSDIFYLLSDRETAIGCCPTNFECDSESAGICISTVTQEIYGVSYGQSCSSTSVTVGYDEIGATATQMNVWIIHNAKTDSNMSSSHNTSSSNTTSSSPRGLSTGAKIGMGVGIPLGIIVIAMIFFAFVIRHRGLRKQRLQQQEPSDISKPGQQGSDAVAETGAWEQALYAKSELDTKTVTSTTVSNREAKSPELNSRQTSTGLRPELDNEPRATIRDVAELSTDSYPERVR
ncbi:hypothetical protein DV736_g592, partial [Chaetothyriales sp. CBS 134916]